MGKKNRNAAPAASREEVPPVVLTLVEVDPATQDPAVLDAIRKKNSAAVTSVLNPCNKLSNKDSSNAADAVWHLVTNGHHATGNLNLLTDLRPVCDRWVQSLTGMGPIMQVCARGSVNCNGIRLDDVWYVPEVKFNLVATAQLTTQGLSVSVDKDGCSIQRIVDDKVVGKGSVKKRLYELDFLDAISSTPSWYITSNAAEHMTGDLHLLKNFTSTRPGRQVQTPTGATLLVLGKGSLTSNQLVVSGVSYIPGLTENIISVTQLTDSGFSVMFETNGCTVKRNRDGVKVGEASHTSGHLYRLDYLLENFSPPCPGRPVQNAMHLENFTPPCPGRPVQSAMQQLNLSDVLCVPGLTRNILSVAQLTESGFTVTFDTSGFNIMRNTDGVAAGQVSHAGDHQ